MREGKLIVFAGGGTGGHLFPAMAVADCLRELDGSVRVQFWGTERAIDKQVVGGSGHQLIAQGVRPFPGRLREWPGFLLAWRASVGRCVKAFREDRPAVVVGAGGYAAGPPVRAAERLGIPTALLNPDAVPGRANRHLASRAREVYVQWAKAQEYLNGSAQVHVTGCPVRAMFLHCSREEGCARFGLDPSRRVLLVTGASQGARTINEALMRIWGEYAGGRWQILHLTGALDFERVRDAYMSIDPSARVLAFTDEMGSALGAADLVISRAGASTLAELTAVGRASVLLPYPYHKDQHQLANARELASAGAAEIVIDQREAGANAESLRGVLRDLMNDEGRLGRMSSAAKSMGRPDAGRTIAARLIDIQ